MEMYADEGDIQRCVQTAIRVAAYQYADYTEMTVGGPVFCSTPILINLFCAPVPDPNSAVLLQAGPNSWPRQNLIHTPEYGTPRCDPQNYG